MRRLGLLASKNSYHGSIRSIPRGVVASQFGSREAPIRSIFLSAAEEGGSSHGYHTVSTRRLQIPTAARQTPFLAPSLSLPSSHIGFPTRYRWFASTAAAAQHEDKGDADDNDKPATAKKTQTKKQKAKPKTVKSADDNDKSATTKKGPTKKQKAKPKTVKSVDDDKTDATKKTAKKKKQQTKKKFAKRIKALRATYKKNVLEKKKIVERKRPKDNPALEHQLEAFYEEIAPMAQMMKLENYLDRLLEKTPLQRKKLVDGSTKLSNQKEIDNQIMNAEDPQNWMQLKVLSFLDVLPLHARPVKTMTSPSESNLMSIRQTTHILKRARDKSVLAEELYWSTTINERSEKHVDASMRQEYHAAKTDKEVNAEARNFARILSERLPSAKYQTVVRLFDLFSQNDNDSSDSEVQTKESSAAESSVDNHEETRSNAETATKAKQKRPLRILALFNNINKLTGTHVHLVAPHLAQFFYFDPPTTPATATEIDSAINGDKMTTTKSVALEESQVIASEQSWQEFKARFVTKMMLLHQKIHAPVVSDAAAGTKGSSLIDKEDELANIITSNLKEASSSAKKKRKKKPQKRKIGNVHLIFDAVTADAYHGQNEEQRYALSPETTVIVDNLPIDTTEDELTELFSRMGTLASIEIFNQRPDLDPGPKSLAALRRMALKARKQGRRRDAVSQKAGEWARPRTPVYAMLSFEEEAAAFAASQDALRIFGMIVRGHSVRSFRANDLTRLYIENIAAREGKETRSAIDIEFSLSQLLNPDLYVSLDIDSSSHKVSKRSAPGSCEIMFPSFEVAHDAFCRLKKDLDFVKHDEECTINWIRTPPDALQYWTRELGGVV